MPFFNWLLRTSQTLSQLHNLAAVVISEAQTLEYVSPIIALNQRKHLVTALLCSLRQLSRTVCPLIYSSDI